ncbi:MAG: hypothetical protein V2B17_04100 [Chloroflexota bacterium]
MTGDIWATLQQAWTGILDLVAKIVSPDWVALVLLIPLAIAPRGMTVARPAGRPPGGAAIA